MSAGASPMGQSVNERCSVHDRKASRTAVFVCQGRAAADGRWAVDRFRDPIARQLLRDEELAVVEEARAAGSPVDRRRRLMVEAVRACGVVVVPRTVAIDEAVRDAGSDQVVIVGAGLDSRPWRLPCLDDVAVYLVDHPSSQADATARAEGLPPLARRLVRVGVDLGRSGLGEALAAAGHDASRPTTWVWEGVIPYLTREDVRGTAAAIAARSAAGSVLVANYQVRSALVVVGRQVGRLAARILRVDNPLADEPWLSLFTPTAMHELLSGCGLTVEQDDDLLTLARQIGSPTTRRRSLGNGRVLVARR